MIFLLGASALLCFSLAAAQDLEALRLCGNLHHTDIHTIPNARAEFQNGKCFLSCYVGNQTLSSDAVNEGFVCDLVGDLGICHKGQCVVNHLAEQKECGQRHNFDFTTLNSAGTGYSNSACTLKCVVEGKTISVNSMHEGTICPSNHNGICRHGECVANVGPSTIPPTVTPPTTKQEVTSPKPTSHRPTISPLKYKLHQLDLTVISANTTDLMLDKQQAYILIKKNVTAISKKWTSEYNVTSNEPRWNEHFMWDNLEWNDTIYVDVDGYVHPYVPGHSNLTFAGLFHKQIYVLFSDLLDTEKIRNGNQLVHDGWFALKNFDRPNATNSIHLSFIFTFSHI